MALVEVAISHVAFILCIMLPHDMLIEMDYARLVRSCFKSPHHFILHFQVRFSNIQWLTETFKVTIPVSAALNGLELATKRLNVGDTSLKGNTEAT